jgi:hypothetical protein
MWVRLARKQLSAFQLQRERGCPASSTDVSQSFWYGEQTVHTTQPRSKSLYSPSPSLLHEPPPSPLAPSTRRCPTIYCVCTSRQRTSLSTPTFHHRDFSTPLDKRAYHTKLLLEREHDARSCTGACPFAQQPVMSLSIDELDATVRAFYEGRGETVCISFWCTFLISIR